MTHDETTAATRHRPRVLMALLLAASAAVSACGDDDEGSTPTVDCSQVTAQKYSELTIWPFCTSCHASTKTGTLRQKAPGNVNFDTYEAAKAQAVASARQVNGGKMPPHDQPQPNADQKAALYAWALCGTPN